MKPLLTALSVFLAITATAHARIGETLAELKARYGEGKSISPRMAQTEQYEWEKDGYKIQASLRSNITVLEFFHRIDTQMTDDDIKTLLKVYRKDVRFSWSTRDNCFKSSDKKMTAGRDGKERDLPSPGLMIHKNFSPNPNPNPNRTWQVRLLEDPAVPHPTFGRPSSTHQRHPHPR